MATEMIGTIVYTNIMHARYTNPPHVVEFTDMQKMRSRITDLQYFMFKPDYILVEFNGKIYDVTNPSSDKVKDAIRIIDEWIDEHYMHRECII
jgi:hypothetical protein